MQRFQNIVIIGSGAIGNAFASYLAETHPKANIAQFSQRLKNINYHDEASIKQASQSVAEPIDLVIVATGMLHDKETMPEKALKELTADNMQKLFNANVIVPSLLGKYFIPKLNAENMSIFAVLSARIGSISDNKIGGWYAYRASKSALNMIIKNASIEVARRNKSAIIIGLHPGTVNSHLSSPFQNNVPKDKLFSADYSAQKLYQVMQNLTPSQSGKCFAWDGQEIQP